MSSTPDSRPEVGRPVADDGGDAIGRDAIARGTPGSRPGLADRALALYPWAQLALLAVPLLALAGPFASVRPGAAGFPYFYRILWFAGLIVAVPLWAKEVRRRRLPLVYSVVTVWWLGWAPVTLLWSPARGVGRTEVLAGSLAMVGSWVVLVLTRGSSRTLRLLRWGWFIAFAVTVAIVAWEWFTGRHLGEVTGVQDWVFSAYSVAGLDTNPNGLSNACVAMVAVLGAQLIREVNARHAAKRGRRVPWRIAVLLVALTVAGYIVYLTGSRAGIMALVLLYVLAAAWSLPACWRSRTRLVVPAVLLCLAVALPVVQRTTLNQLRPPVIGEQAAHQPTSGRYQDNIAEAQKEADVASADKLRRDLTVRGLHYLADSPLLGHGAGAALGLVAADPEYEPGVPERERHVLNLHNTYLEIGVNYGLLGLVPILVVPLLALGTVLRPRPLLRSWPNPVVYECLGILLALLITSLITSTSIGSPTFWLLAAYATALAWNYQDATRAATTPARRESGR